MATKKTTLADIQAFPLKASAASTKLADKVFAKPTKSKAVTPPAVVGKVGKLLAADAAGVPGAKKPTKAPKAKSTLADDIAAKGITPKMLGKSAPKVNKSALAVHNDSKAALLKPKRTVEDTNLIDHEIHGVAALIEQLSKYPKGSLFSSSSTTPWIRVYNMRGRLIGRIKDGPKKTKSAKK